MNNSKTDQSPYLKPNWLVPDKVNAVFTRRSGGASFASYDSFNLASHVGDTHSRVLLNRDKLIVDQGINSICWLDQVHGSDVIKAEISPDRSGNSNSPTADASYTTTASLACAVMVADCLPVLVTDAAGSCVGVAHAGWRGLCSGVISNLIASMPVDPKNCVVWLGPCIGPQVFEVGEEVKKEFTSSPVFSSLGASSAFVKENNGRYLADLVALARMELHALGVSQIFGGDECTYSNPEQYFSYRRDGVTGRMAALIWINS